MQLYILGIFSFYFFQNSLDTFLYSLYNENKGGATNEVCVNGVRDWCRCRNSGIRHV